MEGYFINDIGKWLMCAEFFLRSFGGVGVAKNVIDMVVMDINCNDDSCFLST
jgi:hypothetical protein